MTLKINYFVSYNLYYRTNCRLQSYSIIRKVQIGYLLKYYKYKLY
jgi:hypothetical protein